MAENKKVKIAFTDIDGVVRGKYIHQSKFSKQADKGIGFCDVVFGWDSSDKVYDKEVEKTGWHTGFPDAKLTINKTTKREIPWEQFENLKEGLTFGEIIEAINYLMNYQYESFNRRLSYQFDRNILAQEVVRAYFQKLINKNKNHLETRGVELHWLAGNEEVVNHKQIDIKTREYLYNLFFVSESKKHKFKYIKNSWKNKIHNFYKFKFKNFKVIIAKEKEILPKGWGVIDEKKEWYGEIYQRVGLSWDKVHTCKPNTSKDLDNKKICIELLLIKMNEADSFKKTYFL